MYPTITTPVIQIFTEGQQGCIACTVDFVNTQGRSRLWWVGPSDNGSVLRPVINTSTCVCIEHITPRDAGTYQFIVDFDGVGNINQSIQVLVLSPYTATPTGKASPNIYIYSTDAHNIAVDNFQSLGGLIDQGGGGIPLPQRGVLGELTQWGPGRSPSRLNFSVFQCC